MGVALFLFVIASGGGDGDGDADVDSDADIGGDAGRRWGMENFDLTQTLGWVGIGKAPLILLLATDLSLWGLLGWMINVGAGNIGAGGDLGLAVALIGALLLGGQIAKPVGKIFTAFGEETSGDRLIGCVGSVSTVRIPVAAEGKVGQVDVLDSARKLSHRERHFARLGDRHS